MGCGLSKSNCRFFIRINILSEVHTYSSGLNKHVHKPIYSQKKSCPHAFFYLIRFEKLPQTCILTSIQPTCLFRSQDHTVIWAISKVQRADLTCDVIRNSLRLCFGKIWILIADWSMPEPALVTWHVSYKITTLNTEVLINLMLFLQITWQKVLIIIGQNHKILTTVSTRPWMFYWIIKLWQ